jgi:hypothetical protein
METARNRKPLILVGAIALTVVMILSATFAWFVTNASVRNRLSTKDGLANIGIHEVFVEPDDWKPGQTITKQVSVINTGTAPALARISFEELLTVNRPPAGETTLFNAALETAGKRPVTVPQSMFTGADWFIVTTVPNTARGGIALAASYAPAVVYARHNTTGATDSYSFIVVAPIVGTTYAGQFQEVTFTRAWNDTTKVLTLTNLMYNTYQGELSATADWRVDRPAVGLIGTSRAEAKINAMAGVIGMYPGNIKLNYSNITTVPTLGSWYYNAADGYFYYVGLVAGGTITPHMLSSLLLDSAASGNYYSNMTFDLTVHLNAIQNSLEAVAGEWPTATGALKTALDALCE